MSTMKQLWNMNQIRDKISSVIVGSDEKFAEAIYQICVSSAQRAKKEHTYRNIKGQLESSVGVVVLKDREEIMKWYLLASEGSQPDLGIMNIRDTVQNQIIGKSTLPNGQFIPQKGVVGIVFAAAPYAGYVEGKNRKKVLTDFVPDGQMVISILNIFK